MARVLPVSEGPIREIWSGCLPHSPAQNRHSSRFSSWTHSVHFLHLPHSICQFKVDQQQYADDTQVFISLSKSNSPDRVSRLETALVHLTSWFFHNGLALNPEKSSALILAINHLITSLRLMLIVRPFQYLTILNYWALPLIHLLLSTNM